MTTLLKAVIALLLFINFSDANAYPDGVFEIAAPRLTCDSGGSINLAEGGDHVNDNIYTCSINSIDGRYLAFVSSSYPKYIVSGKRSWTRGIFEDAYVPYSGFYKLRIYICKSSVASKCSTRNATTYIDSVASPRLTSALRISDQNVSFGNVPLTPVLYSFNTCMALVDSEYGYVYGYPSVERYFCEDGSSLPEEPATCVINRLQDLNVEMGEIERSKIATIPASGTAGNIKKTISVQCSRDSGITVSTSFQFTPLVGYDKEVISVNSSDNLGVAIFYNGNLVGPSLPPITENFDATEATRELEFQVVRKPDSLSKNIPTGDFTASAVMVMTEQ